MARERIRYRINPTDQFITDTTKFVIVYQEKRNGQWDHTDHEITKPMDYDTAVSVFHSLVAANQEAEQARTMREQTLKIRLPNHWTLTVATARVNDLAEAADIRVCSPMAGQASEAEATYTFATGDSGGEVWVIFNSVDPGVLKDLRNAAQYLGYGIALY